MSKKKPVVASVAIALMLAVTGCGTGGNVSASDENILRVAFKTSNPSTLDPATGSAGSDATILWTVFDTLIGFDQETLEAEPRLAKSWTWQDPLTLELSLVPDATFQDGTPMDADAVKFNLDRSRAGEGEVKIKADLANVQSIDAVNATTVVLHLGKPSASLLLTLADRAGMMISPTAFKADPTGFGRNPVGAGPYKFVKWTTGSLIEVAEYTGYWNSEETKLDGIQFFLMPDPQTRLNALRSGDVDLIYSVDPSTVPTLKNESSLTVVQAPSLAYYQLFMNTGQAPFDNVKVRQAISMAIDRDALAKAVEGEYGEAAWMPVPSGSFAFSPSFKGKPKFNPAEAKKLLIEAGYPNGFTFDMAFEVGSLNARRSEIIRAQLTEIGVTVNLLPSETATATARYLEGEVPVLNNQWTGRLDPAATYGGQFSANAFTNTGNFEDPRIQAALDAGDAGKTQEERAASYRTLNQLLIDEGFNVPLYFTANLVAHNERVLGFISNPLAKPRFDGVSLTGH